MVVSGVTIFCEQQVKKKDVSAMQFLECGFLQVDGGKNLEKKLQHVPLSDCDFRLDSHEELQFVAAALLEPESIQMVFVVYYDEQEQQTYCHVSNHSRILSKDSYQLKIKKKFQSFAFSGVHRIFAAYYQDDRKVSLFMSKLLAFR